MSYRVKGASCQGSVLRHAQRCCYCTFSSSLHTMVCDSLGTVVRKSTRRHWNVSELGHWTSQGLRHFTHKVLGS